MCFSCLVGYCNYRGVRKRGSGDNGWRKSMTHVGISRFGLAVSNRRRWLPRLTTPLLSTSEVPRLGSTFRIMSTTSPHSHLTPLFIKSAEGGAPSSSEVSGFNIEEEEEEDMVEIAPITSGLSPPQTINSTVTPITVNQSPSHIKALSEWPMYSPLHIMEDDICDYFDPNCASADHFDATYSTMGEST